MACACTVFEHRKTGKTKTTTIHTEHALLFLDYVWRSAIAITVVKTVFLFSIVLIYVLKNGENRTFMMSMPMSLCFT